MPDSFIHKLNESTSNLNDKDYVIFDILDSVNLTYNSKKISFDTLNSAITSKLLPVLDTIYLKSTPTAENPTIVVTNNNLSIEKPATFTNIINMGNNNIKDVADPVDSKDAVNLNYFTNTLSDQLNLYMPISGGSFLKNVSFSGISEKISNASSASNLILNLSSGNNFLIDLNTNVNSISVNNIPGSDAFTITLIVKQLGTVGSYYNISNWTINGSTVKWALGASPTVTQITNKIDIFAISKLGSDWFGFIGGQEF
jgi:hypothetical protein